MKRGIAKYGGYRWGRRGRWAWAAWGLLVGVAIGLGFAHGSLRMAKEYNRMGDEALVGASGMYVEAAQYYTDARELAEHAIDVCLGRVGL